MFYNNNTFTFNTNNINYIFVIDCSDFIFYTMLTISNIYYVLKPIDKNTF